MFGDAIGAEDFKLDQLWELAEVEVGGVVRIIYGGVIFEPRLKIPSCSFM